MRFLTTSLLCLSVALLSCRGKKSDSPNDNGGGGFNLTPAQEKHFETWKASLEKSCEVRDIFKGDREGAQIGLDSKLFFEKTGQSLHIEGENGLWAIFAPPHTLAGFSETTLSESSSSGQSLDVKSVRSGSLCDVYIKGEKVFSGYILARVPVAAIGNAEGLPAKPLTHYAVIQNGTFLSRVDSRGFIGAVTSNLRSQKDLSAALLARLGLAQSATKYFPVTESSELEVSASLPGHKDIPNFADIFYTDAQPFEDHIYASQDKLSGILGAPQKIELVLRPNQIAFGDSGNSADEGKLWFVRATVSAARKQGNSFEFTPSEVSVAFDGKASNESAANCFVERLSRIRGYFNTNERFLPRYSLVATPCESLASSMPSALYENESARWAIVSRFEGFAPSPTGLYFGWDLALKNLVKEVQNRNLSVVETLDRENKAPVIQKLDAFLSELKRVMASHASLSPVKESLEDMVVSWSFTGQEVSSPQLERIAAALANTVSEFPYSNHRLIVSLGNSFEKQLESVDYALALSGEKKQALVALKKEAEDLGLVSWVSETFSSVLQTRPDDAKLEGWRASLAASREFHNREIAKSGEPKEASKRKIREVLANAMKEGWLKPEFDALDALATFGAKTQRCKATSKTSSDVVNCVGSSKFKLEENNVMGRKFNGRYVKAAAVFSTLFDSLIDFQYASTRHELEDFFDPVWSRCNDETFQTKLTTLDSQVKQLLAAGEGFDRFEVERKIADTLRDCW